MSCPCGLGEIYQACCARFIEGSALPQTAEQLMRSRYTAYSMSNIQYIEQTMRGPAAKNFDPISANHWATEANWLNLTVTDHTQNSEDSATVSFIACYEERGQKKFLAEKSDFKKVAGRWYYTEGQAFKIGRNENCPCGSGKKYKRCCYSE